MSLSVERIEGTEQAVLLAGYKQELEEELKSVLTYWEQYSLDKQKGGFYGSIDNDNIVDPSAPKGIVLYSRILWAFSAAYHFNAKEEYFSIASRAFDYILVHFIDHQFGGVYWSVDASGQVLEGRKQIYGLAFCIYGLSEYYKATGDNAALHHAKQLYEKIEEHSHDNIQGGYIEALSRQWQPLNNVRLSEKDDNEKKTMNTHLHIIEAYANLYRAWPDPKLRDRIINLLEMFNHYIINKAFYHLNLFMDENWQVKSMLQSYGHDIEASWLLLECAEAIEYELYIDHFKKLAVKLADAATEGLDRDGGLWYEYDPINKKMTREKHSWPQAEAMVGFFNAWQLTGQQSYLEHSLQAWEFVKSHIRDNIKGEWFWGVYEDYSVMKKDKAGFWKCPYHNSRACLELIRRISTIAIK